MTYPDGWKDEEGDVNDAPVVIEKRVMLPPPTIEESMSTVYCGCDRGANWVCERHRLERKDDR